MPLAIDILGWSGALLLLVAYALLSARRLEGHAAAYQWMNIVGSLCLLSNAGYHGALPSAFVNSIWILIAFGALVYHAKRPAECAGGLEESPALSEPTIEARV